MSHSGFFQTNVHSYTIKDTQQNREENRQIKKRKNIVLVFKKNITVNQRFSVIIS